MKVLRLTSVLLAVVAMIACNSDIVTDDMEPENVKTHARRKVQNNGEPDGGPGDDQKAHIIVYAGSQTVEENGFSGRVSWEQKTLRDYCLNNRLKIEKIEGNDSYYTGSNPDTINVTAQAEFEGVLDPDINAMIKVTFDFSVRVLEGYDEENRPIYKYNPGRKIVTKSCRIAMYNPYNEN